MSRLVFSADDGHTGRELWVTDGTAAGTSLLADIFQGGAFVGSTPPTGFTALADGRLVFSAGDASTGVELWVTDGTAAGTSLVADINPGGFDFYSYFFPNGSFPGGFTALSDGRLVFSASDGSTGRELWVTDGTAAGTSRVADINQGSGSSDIAGFTALSDRRLAFVADDGSTGRELWVTDGTAAGTSRLADINPGSGSAFDTFVVPDFTALPDGRLAFGAGDASAGRELWVTDGTAAGTSRLADINPGSGGSDPSGFTALPDGRLVFAARDAGTGRELWVTDGTTPGTSRLAEIRTGNYGGYPANFTALPDGRLVFSAADRGTGRELWVTDGTAGGTSLLADIAPGRFDSSPRDFAALSDGRLVFTANDGSTGRELWVTDGTARGTSLLADIDPFGSGSYLAGFGALADGRLVFRADDGSTGYELWTTDGTAAGTSRLADIWPDSIGSFPADFAALGAPSALSIAALPAPVVEGDAGTTAIAFTVTRSGNIASAASASWVVSGSGPNPASAADFAGGVLPSGTVSFAAGETSRTIVVSIAGDTAVEPDEGFSVTLSAPVGASIAMATASGTIRNDDAASLSIVADSAVRPEGDAGGTEFTFTVTRSGDLGGAASVAWAVAGRTAEPATGADFLDGVLPSGTVSFAAGETSKTITLRVAGDTTVEADEGFQVRLSAPVGAVLEKVQANGLIRNDDAALPPPSLSIAALSADNAEGDSGTTAFTFRVTRSGDLGAVSAAWAVAGSGPNPASEGDFVLGVLPSGTVSFAAGQTTALITVDVAGETASEADETFTVTLSAPSPGAQILTPSATGRILDDDGGAAVTVRGGDGDDFLDGGGTIGNVLLDGRAGNDSLFGGDGADTSLGREGADLIYGYGGDDVLVGGPGDDLLLGDDGGLLDFPDFPTGDDSLRGEDGDDALFGDEGADTLDGGAGNDIVDGGTGDDRLLGALGDDTLRGGAGRDSLLGGDGNDMLIGSGGADRLSAGSGNDTLIGGAGADVLTGGAGADVLRGGAGPDLFRFTASGDSTEARAGRDRILDFSVTDGDRIDVSAIDANTLLAGNQAFVLLDGEDFSGTPGEVMITALATTLRIDFDVNGDGMADLAITVAGTPSLTAAQFIL